MQNPFAIGMQWPDASRRYLVHLQRPYFTASIHETASAAWLLISWAPGTREANRAQVFRAAAAFCQTQLDQRHVPIEFVERRHGYVMPSYLIAQTVDKQLFIVEPDHYSPLVEIRDAAAEPKSKTKSDPRFDVVTQWRLADMRKYYRQFQDRQKVLFSHPSAVAVSK